LPGAVLLDAAFAAIRQAHAIDITEWQIASAKFVAMVRPGDVLEVEHDAPGAGTIRFTIRSLDRTVATGTLLRSSAASAA
jgi:hypothetical protein